MKTRGAIAVTLVLAGLLPSCGERPPTVSPDAISVEAGGAQKDPVSERSGGASVRDLAVSLPLTERILRFPKDFSIGNLYLKQADGSTPWTRSLPARGAVTAPAHDAAGLSLSRNGDRETSALTALGANDLQSLWFDRGYLDEDWIVRIGGLTGLKNLSLGGTQITDRAMASLADLRSLETLELANTRITGSSLVHLQNMSRLRDLDLSGTQVADFGMMNLGRLASLERLWLNETSVTDDALAHLARMTSLRLLNLQSTPITDRGVKAIESLNALTFLSLSNTSITNKAVSSLSRLRRLRTLDLSNTRISDGAIEGLKSLGVLQRLHLNGTRITDSGLAYLANLPSLGVVLLFKTQITRAGVVNLQNALPQCKVIYDASLAPPAVAIEAPPFS